MSNKQSFFERLTGAVRFNGSEIENKSLKKTGDRDGQLESWIEEESDKDGELTVDVYQTPEAIVVKEEIVSYIVRITHATRTSQRVTLGASPRASLALLQAGKVLAALRGRDFVTPDDIKALGGDGQWINDRHVMIAAYWKNSNYTELPNTFIMPSTDWMGMADFVSDTYPLATKIEAIRNMFKEITGEANFKIGHVAYLQADKNSARNVTANRYILYRNDPEALSMSIPIDFTMLPADTGDQVSWSQGAYGQYSGVLVTRPLEMLYFDQTGSGT